VRSSPSPGCRARRAASNRPLPNQRHRARPWLSEGAPTADAWPRAHRLSRDLHARSRVDAQHPPWLLPCCRISSAAAGVRMDMEPSCRSALNRSATMAGVRSSRPGQQPLRHPTPMQENQPSRSVGDKLLWILARRLCRDRRRHLVLPRRETVIRGLRPMVGRIPRHFPPESCSSECWTTQPGPAAAAPSRRGADIRDNRLGPGRRVPRRHTARR
jgi:hypothetical protein